MNHHTTFFRNLMNFVYRPGVRFHDIRSFKTFIWAIMGLILIGTPHLSHWAIALPGNAQLASKVRRLSRWLHNELIDPMTIYPPLAREVASFWHGQTIYLALDTSLLWERFVMVRVALLYRGRALPLGWVVLEGSSATVPLAKYETLLRDIAAFLPSNSRVILLADRGFGAVTWMQLVRQLGWHFRLRLKGNWWFYRGTKPKQKIKVLLPAVGHARYYHHIWLTEQRFGPLHLAVGHRPTTADQEPWFIVSDEPVGDETFIEYGYRFGIEENFLDDKSAGFQLESSLLNDASALNRLCLILAVATLYLVSTGTALVEMEACHEVDAHWKRGLSYLQIGWRWVKQACLFGKSLLASLWLSSHPDPNPAIASQKQTKQKKWRPACAVWL